MSPKPTEPTTALKHLEAAGTPKVTSMKHSGVAATSISSPKTATANVKPPNSVPNSTPRSTYPRVLAPGSIPSSTSLVPLHLLRRQQLM